MAQNMELSLPILQDFPSISGNIDIVERTAPHYKSIGTQLLDDKDGAIVSGMEKANAFKPVPIMENIYERWMKSDKSWQKLIQCLKSRKLNVLAQEIEDTLKHKGQGADGGAVHTDGPGQPQGYTRSLQPAALKYKLFQCSISGTQLGGAAVGSNLG